MLDFRRVVKNRKIQPEAAFCPTKNQGLEWMNSNPRMQIALILKAKIQKKVGTKSYFCVIQMHCRHFAFCTLVAFSLDVSFNRQIITLSDRTL